MNCKNCNLDLSEKYDYCSQCGAKVIRNRLTIKQLLSDFSALFLNYDNKFLQTFITLFKNPEKVIGGYIDGTRKKYVNVVSYYAIGITLTGFQIFILRKFFPESLDLTFLTPDNVPKSATDIDWIYDYLSFFALLNLPIYALISKFTFIKLKKFNYTEHFVIMTYIFGHYAIFNFLILIVNAMLGGNYYLVGNLFNLLLMIYTAYCYKRLYPLTIKQILLRTLLFFGVLIFLLIIASVIQFIVLIATGDFQKMMEDAKALQEISYILSSAINWTS
jgi:hypothetical protein